MAWKRLGELLRDAGFIDERTLAQALADQAHTGTRLGRLLVERGAVSEARVVVLLARQLGFLPAEVPRWPLPRDVRDLVPQAAVEAYGLIPLEVTTEGGVPVLVVAMTDPTNKEAIAALERHAQRRVVPRIIGESALEAAIAMNYADVAEPVVAGVPMDASDAPPASSEDHSIDALLASAPHVDAPAVGRDAFGPAGAYLGDPDPETLLELAAPERTLPAPPGSIAGGLPPPSATGPATDGGAVDVGIPRPLVEESFDDSSPEGAGILELGAEDVVQESQAQARGAGNTDVRICTTCGGARVASARFCPLCGARVSLSAPPPPRSSAPAVAVHDAVNEAITDTLRGEAVAITTDRTAEPTAERSAERTERTERSERTAEIVTLSTVDASLLGLPPALEPIGVARLPHSAVRDREPGALRVAPDDGVADGPRAAAAHVDEPGQLAGAAAAAPLLPWASAPPEGTGAARVDDIDVLAGAVAEGAGRAWATAMPATWAQPDHVAAAPPAALLPPEAGPHAVAHAVRSLASEWGDAAELPLAGRRTAELPPLAPPDPVARAVGRAPLPVFAEPAVARRPLVPYVAAAADASAADPADLAPWAPFAERKSADGEPVDAAGHASSARRGGP